MNFSECVIIYLIIQIKQQKISKNKDLKVFLLQKIILAIMFNCKTLFILRF